MAVDPITIEVVIHRLQAATDEMLATLVKTAYSPNIKERRDCSVGVFDRKGDLIALTAMTGGHLASLIGMVDNILSRHALDSLEEGDAFLTNDPYVGGGAHLMDLAVMSPIFVDGEVVAFAVSLGHHSDIGGKVPGSESADCTSIFQEGLRIPPVKLMAAGVLQQDIFDMVMLNTRTPLEREGDLKAQIATNNTGIRRIQDTFAAFGTETMFEAIEGMLDYAERRTRQEIAKIPDGTYENTDYLDNDGVKDIEVKLKVAITIKGDRISFDFTGCDPQISGGRNMPYVTTLACVYYSVKAMTDPYLPPNAGYFRAIDVVAPKGTVVNCDAPAATSDRAASSNIMGDVLMGAWAKVLPERAMAGCGPLAGYIFSGLDPLNGLYYVDYETYAGASGGFMHMDGKDAVRVHTSGASNLPVESVEQEYPLTVERYELVADSGGPGRHRGGLATVRDIRMWGEQPELAGRGLRQTRPALGMFGGRDGTVGYFKIEPGTDNEQKLPGSFSQLPVEPGTMARVQTPSGAGYGPPWERDPDKVLDDIRSGKISAPAAERDYGVVMENGEIDEDKTASRRAQMEAEADGS